MKYKEQKFIELALLFGKENISDSIKRAYREVIEPFTDEQMQFVCNAVETMYEEGEIKSFPLPILFKKLGKKFPKKKPSRSYLEIEPCSYCEDSGTIPAIGFLNRDGKLTWNPNEKHGNHIYHYSFRCKCSNGEVINLQDYFKLFPNFQFIWDKRRFKTYPEAFRERYYIIIGLNRKCNHGQILEEKREEFNDIRSAIKDVMEKKDYSEFSIPF